MNWCLRNGRRLLLPLIVVLSAACSSFSSGTSAPPSTNPSNDGGATNINDGAVVPGDDGGGPVSEVTVIAENQLEITSLVASATFLYWSEQSQGFVHRVPLANNDVPVTPSSEVISAKPGAPVALAFQNNVLYWGDAAKAR